MEEHQESSQLSKNNWEEFARFCSPESIQHLERSMASLEAGAAPTPSFKLYGKSDESLVTRFLSDMRKTGKYPVWMLDYEDTRVEKFGPQGGHAPWKELVDDFMLYKSRPSNVKFVDETVMAEMRADYSQLRCQMLSVNSALQQLRDTDKIQDRAAGWNTFNLKKTDQKAQAEAITLARNGNWKYGYGYVFSRFNKRKKRIFMPMPYSLMIKQAQYFIPFLEGIQASLLRREFRSPFLFWGDKIGFDRQVADWTMLLNKIVPAGKIPEDCTIVYIQRDFEKMDTTTAGSQYEKLFLPIMGYAYHQRMKDMDECFMATTSMPIITPTGTMTGNHGTASGAEVTNGGETVCNDYYDRRAMKIFYSRKSMKCVRIVSAGNGDDGIAIFIVPTSDLAKFKAEITAAYEQAAEECGFRIQALKWHVSTEFGLYCQNMYWKDGNRFCFAYPASLILNAIINPEHEYTPSEWDKDYRDIDIIQKLDNGVGLPYYHELVDYVRHGTKYPLLGKDEAETTRILSKYDRYRALQPIGERFNRQDWQITKSPTIKYILSTR